MTKDFDPSLNLSRAAKNQFPGRGAQVEAFIRGARYAADQIAQDLVPRIERMIREYVRKNGSTPLPSNELLEDYREENK